jgi:hypothetical protein
LCSGVIDVLLRYLDLQFEERALSRAKRLRNQIRNVEVLNFKMDGPSGAMGIVRFTQTAGGASNIPQWTPVDTAVTPSRPYLTLEAAIAPGLGLTVDVPVVQGTRIIDELLAEASDGSLEQLYVLLNNSPIKDYIEIKINSLAWTRVDDIFDFGPNDQVYEIAYDENMFGYIRFGDNENGLSPALGDKIEATYVATLGSAGVVEANLLVSLSAVTGYDVTNPEGTAGGEDGDTVKSIATNAPKQFSTQWRGIALQDIENLATRVSGVYSASAVHVSGFVVDLFIVPTGGGSPSQTLLDAVYNYLSPLRIAWGTVLQVQGFVLAYMLVDTNIKLKSKQWSKESAEAIIRAAVNEFLNYTETKVGDAWAPSDFHALLEGLEGGNLVDVVDDTIFSRVPNVVANTQAAGSTLFFSAITINPACDYTDWTILRKSSTEFWVYAGSVLQANFGTLDVEYTSDNGEITFILNKTNPPDTIPVGSAWTFSTSIANGPVEVADDELPQPFAGVEQYFIMTIFYPDEWTLGD